ncbi:hypothetical protein K4P40_11505 [Staphylococcus epidermidis]|nr:hypothetical protein [Staphylococcus epidermidis]
MANIPDFINNSKAEEKRAIESTYQDKIHEEKPNKNKEVYTTIKVRKEYKEIFDALAHESYQTRIDFIEDLINYWKDSHKKE